MKGNLWCLLMLSDEVDIIPTQSIWISTSSRGVPIWNLTDNRYVMLTLCIVRTWKCGQVPGGETFSSFLSLEHPLSVPLPFIIPPATENAVWLIIVPAWCQAAESGAGRLTVLQKYTHRCVWGEGERESVWRRETPWKLPHMVQHLCRQEENALSASLP